MGCICLFGLRTAATELIVEIVDPENGIITTTNAAAEELRAVAYLVGEEGTVEVDADITWDFGDGTTADNVAYTAHRWEDEGEYLVTVSAQWDNLEATDEADATVEAATTTYTTTTYVYGKIPGDFAEGYSEGVSAPYPLLARRIDDGLMVWCEHTYVFHVAHYPPPGMYYVSRPPWYVLPFSEGDVVYNFAHGDLPPGVYELIDYGYRSYCGPWGIANSTPVTVISGTSITEVGMVRQDRGYNLHGVQGSGTFTGTVYEGAEPLCTCETDEFGNVSCEWAEFDYDPLPGALIQCDGFSISGCQTTTDENGSFTLQNAGGTVGEITGQKEGHGSAVAKLASWANPCIFLPNDSSTPTWGRVAGTVAAAPGGGSFREICMYDIPGQTSVQPRIVLPESAQEYSVTSMCNGQTVWAVASWNATKEPYGMCSPDSPRNVAVNPMGTTLTNFSWDAYYGLIWGRVTDSTGAPLSSAKVHFWVGDPVEKEAWVSTDGSGYFVLRLRPGTYQVHAEIWDTQLTTTTREIEVTGHHTTRLLPDFVLE